ncbi:MAG: hypothetical protein HDR17_02605 [Lachnospiraceae bacterium]|nr:hypothetical protein [Lachnospiraceae bacterium]
MDLFMVVFAVIFLVFLGSGLYLTVLQELHKKSKGVSVEYESVQDIEKILKENLDCSFVKDIGVGKKENIEFNCKYGIHTGIIKDGKFYIDKSLRKFSGHRDVEEAWYLEKFIKGVFYPNEPKEDLEIKFAKYIKIFNISRIIKYVVILCVAIWVFLLIGGMDSLKSKGVSRMCFTDYSEEITIGEALQATCSNGKWSSNKIGDGIYHVTFSGYGANGSILIILFQTNGNECSIKSITIDGEDITWMQGLFLEALYEGVADENGVKDISAIDGGKAEESIPEMNMEELNKTDLEQKRENVDTYTEENEFDEELYDSEVQGFSNQDESDSSSYQLNANVDYLQAYSSIVEEIWHSYDEYCEYTLFDLDQDGIKELITSQGTCDADWTNDVYTIEDGYILMIGQFYGPVMLYVAEDGNGLYAVYGHMGVQNIDQITKNGSQLLVDTIMNGDIGEEDYYSNDNPVNFVAVTDDSLLRQ